MRRACSQWPNPLAPPTLVRRRCLLRLMSAASTTSDRCSTPPQPPAPIPLNIYASQLMCEPSRLALSSQRTEKEKGDGRVMRPHQCSPEAGKDPAFGRVACQGNRGRVKEVWGAAAAAGSRGGWGPPRKLRRILVEATNLAIGRLAESRSRNEFGRGRIDIDPR
jgi:hypothetical protein